MLACIHPGKGKMLYSNAWGGLFIVVGRLAMPLLDKLNIVPRLNYLLFCIVLIISIVL